MPAHVFAQVDRGLTGRGLAPADALVALLGFAFKSNSGDTRFTPVGPLVAALRAAGYGPGLAICDPMVTEREATHHGITLEPDWRRAVAGADAVLILAGHDEFAAISPEALAEAAPGALVYDGRIYYPRARINELEALGLAYLGVGR
jgi:UDP-N-acetyl-D-mannosaminuronic acid dehydrogenase